MLPREGGSPVRDAPERSLGVLQGVLACNVRAMSPFLIRQHATATRSPEERRTYTVTEVADIVGISRSTAYECVRRGEIPSRRFGRRIVVLRHELERLLGER
jgi:excisionase family DNA binding protein